MATYAGQFGGRLAGQLARCGQYVKGLFHACKSNIERMDERLPDSTYDTLHHFISESPWDGRAVMGEVAQRVAASLAALDGPQGLLLDESGWEKAGEQSVGVARQYIGQVGKTSNGQVGVFAVLARGRHAGLVGGRLYLPQSWCGDAARCQKARIPLAERSYRTKPELAGELVRELLGSGQVQADWVGGDAAYGTSPALRQTLMDVGQAFVLDVQPALSGYLRDPTPPAGPVWSGRGRRPQRPQPVGQAQAVARIGEELPSSAWQTLTYRPGTQGPLQRQAVLVPFWLWNTPAGRAQPFHLLISREVDGTEVKHSLCYTPAGEPALDVASALYRQMQRYWIERVFQEAKQQLGLHQYQTRSWIAWEHHVALTMMALHFMLQVQLEDHDPIPYLSFPAIKLLLAQKLQNMLDQDDALLRAIIKRTSYLKRMPRLPEPPE